MASCSRVLRALQMALVATAAFALAAGLFSGCADARMARAESSRAATPSPRAEWLPPAGLDASEEITPEELASIPEPVPSAAMTSDPLLKPAPKAAEEAPEHRSQGVGVEEPSVQTATPTPPPVAPGPWIWRVQVLATPEKALAARVAQEAAERLGTASRVDHEPPLYKVRLGGFGSEADAQILKARAVEMGYPGAFRVKIHAAATDE